MIVSHAPCHCPRRPRRECGGRPFSQETDGRTRQRCDLAPRAPSTHLAVIAIASLVINQRSCLQLHPPPGFTTHDACRSAMQPRERVDIPFACPDRRHSIRAPEPARIVVSPSTTSSLVRGHPCTTQDPRAIANALPHHRRVGRGPLCWFQRLMLVFHKSSSRSPP